MKRATIALAILAAPAFADGPGQPVPDAPIYRGPVLTCGLQWVPETASWRTVAPCERERDEREDRPRFTRPTPDIPGGGDPDLPKQPIDPPRGGKPHDNRGLGNGDEGDCRGRGCGDADNPVHGDDQ